MKRSTSDRPPSTLPYLRVAAPVDMLHESDLTPDKLNEIAEAVLNSDADFTRGGKDRMALTVERGVPLIVHIELDSQTEQIARTLSSLQEVFRLHLLAVANR